MVKVAIPTGVEGWASTPASRVALVGVPEGRPLIETVPVGAAAGTERRVADAWFAEFSNRTVMTFCWPWTRAPDWVVMLVATFIFGVSFTMVKVIADDVELL